MSRIVVTDDHTRDEPAELLKQHGEADVETSDLHTGRRVPIILETDG